jgi:hypothetical protein
MRASLRRKVAIEFGMWRWVRRAFSSQAENALL